VTIISRSARSLKRHGAIENSRRIQPRPHWTCRPYFKPAFQRERSGVLLPRRARPSPPSGQSVCGHRDASLPSIPSAGKASRLKARTKPGLLNKCLPPAFSLASPFPRSASSSPLRGVNKRTSADKGPGKISPRGPFRDDQREFADLPFPAAGLAGLKRIRRCRRSSLPVSVKGNCRLCKRVLGSRYI